MNTKEQYMLHIYKNISDADRIAYGKIAPEIIKKENKKVDSDTPTVIAMYANSKTDSLAPVIFMSLQVVAELT